MNDEREHPTPRLGTIAKAATGIQGFDEISGGGLPAGRPTLVCGSAGSGKTLFGLEFLVRGATLHGEHGVLVSFEESAAELTANVASLGFDLAALVAQGKLFIDHIHIERSEIEETGEYDLEGLFIRLGAAIDAVGAKRIVLDTLEALFAALPNEGIVRAELRRLFRWLKERGVTAVITAERGEGTLTRHGLEEYVSDCVLLLDMRMHDDIATRRLRIVKYRGSGHGTNEYPFIIHERGLAVLPITSAGLEHKVTDERVSTGVERLDAMLGGKGLYRGSSVLISGTAGSGKTSLAASIAAAACRRGERCLYFAFEESEHQIIRNMRSIGIDLEPFVERGLLRFRAVRPTFLGLETHLAEMHRLLDELGPSTCVVDPITNLLSIGTWADVHGTLTRLIDALKTRGVTGVFTSLTGAGHALEQTQAGVSSLMDTWILVQVMEGSGERNRGLYVVKARGMAHSNQVREFVMSERGLELTDVYVGPGGVLTGAARHTQEAKERADALLRKQEAEKRRRDAERRRALLEAQIAALEAELAAAKEDANESQEQAQERADALVADQEDIARLRHADPDRRGAPAQTNGGSS